MEEVGRNTGDPGTPFSHLARRPIVRGNRGALVAARLKAKPWLFYPFALVRETHKKRLVRKNTEIVIEGIARTANHFATYAFLQAQDRPVRIAHHFHAPAQILLAVRWDIPALLLLREPVEQVVSTLVYFRWQSAATALRCYNIFYESVLPVLGDIVVADFEEVTSDMGKVIRRVNRKYGTGFREFVPSNENVGAVFATIEREHSRFMYGLPERDPRPARERAALKAEARERLEHPELAGPVARSRELYAEIAACAD